MPRKSKEEIYFEIHKQTIHECLSGQGSQFYQEDKTFVCLLLCGYSASAAYRIAYSSSNATNSSAAVMASRRIREPHIQTLLKRVIDVAEDGMLYLSKKGFKSKMRRQSWRGKPKKNIDTSPI